MMTNTNLLLPRFEHILDQIDPYEEVVVLDLWRLDTLALKELLTCFPEWQALQIIHFLLKLWKFS
jgi:hypothetical protein